MFYIYYNILTKKVFVLKIKNTLQLKLKLCRYYCLYQLSRIIILIIESKKISYDFFFYN